MAQGADMNTDEGSCIKKVHAFYLMAVEIGDTFNFSPFHCINGVEGVNRAVRM